MSNTYSIQKRLLSSLLIGLPALWLSVMIVMAVEIWHEMSELTDTQITQLARHLAATTPERSFKVAMIVDKVDLLGDLGDSEDDYMGFAVFEPSGRLVMADDNGRHFEYLPTTQGFVADTTVSGLTGQWRLFYGHDAVGRVVVVGQNLDSRHEVILETLAVQSAAALLGLMLLAGWLWWSVHRAFAPLNALSHTISQRLPQDNSPIPTDTPLEVRPLVIALNAWFIKVSQTLERESRFTSDASHELRTPLTALQLQVDILGQEILLLDDSNTQDMLLQRCEQLKSGIARSNHLIEQLLTLAKLTPEQGLNSSQLTLIDWYSLSDQVLSEISIKARQKQQKLVRQIVNHPINLMGNPVLIAVLLRNLLDNAIRYSPQGSTITLRIDTNQIVVQDNGRGVMVEDLERLSERFFRPAGQAEHGSGLGLSIVCQIATLHNLVLTFDNRMDNGQVVGFEVVIYQA